MGKLRFDAPLPNDLPPEIFVSGSSDAGTGAARTVGALAEGNAARRQGLVAGGGLLDPPLMPALSGRLCVSRHGRSATWLLVHGKDEHAVRALHTGDVVFTHIGG